MNAILPMTMLSRTIQDGQKGTYIKCEKSRLHNSVNYIDTSFVKNTILYIHFKSVCISNFDLFLYFSMSYVSLI